MSLAELIGGVSTPHLALTRSDGDRRPGVGKVSCTLGEVKNRADLIIYWGGNPAECHPRHFTKYTLMPKGKFVPNGRKDRTMVLVDIRETPERQGRRHLPAGQARARTSRCSRRCGPWSRARARSRRSSTETGLPLEQLQDLADRMKAASSACSSSAWACR